MPILNLASRQSAAHGYDYFKSGKVKSLIKNAGGTFDALVAGGSDYHVALDAEHCSRSKCDCPFAKDRQRICKHIVAAYFAAFPDKAEEYRAEVVAAGEAWELRQAKIKRKIDEFLMAAPRKKLADAVEFFLYECEDWLYDRFVDGYIDLDEE